jgi:hypothetical protein
MVLLDRQHVDPVLREEHRRRQPDHAAADDDDRHLDVGSGVLAHPHLARAQRDRATFPTPNERRRRPRADPPDAARDLVEPAAPPSADPAAAELLADYKHKRARGQRRIARSLARARALKPGLRERDAADLIHALMSPELYQLLVVDRGWRPERYEQWLATTLANQLLSGPRHRPED